jgi:hypothetical protein
MAWSLAFAGDDGVEGTVELALGATRARYRAELVLPAGAGPAGVVVVHDDDVPLPRGTLLEVRSDGLWAEVVHEGEDHWAFALEAFGLRFDTLEEARTSDVGERVCPSASTWSGTAAGSPARSSSAAPASPSTPPAPSPSPDGPIPGRSGRQQRVAGAGMVASTR